MNVRRRARESRDFKLFEKAGIILKPKEEIVKRGVFGGEVPKGVKRSAWSGKLQLDWAWVEEGELVLTNKRLIPIGANRWHGIVVYPDLILKTFTAVREGDELTFLLSLGKEKVEFYVEDASQWVTAIKEQCQKEEDLQMRAHFCRYCGAENKDDAVFCEKCGKKIGQ